MAKLDGNESQIKGGADVIKFVSADYNDERSTVDVPPDTATTGKEVLDNGIYQATLSMTGNNEVSIVNPLETAYNAGGTSNLVSITVQIDKTDATHKDVGNFVVMSWKRGLKVGEVQAWTAEAKSSGAIVRTRP